MLHLQHAEYSVVVQGWMYRVGFSEIVRVDISYVAK